MVLGLVKQMFLCFWFKWPSTLANDFVRCFLKSLAVRPEQVAKWPF